MSTQKNTEANLTVRQIYAKMKNNKAIVDQCRAAKRATQQAKQAALLQRPKIFSLSCFAIDTNPDHNIQRADRIVVDCATWDKTDLKTLKKMTGVQHCATSLSAIALTYMLAEHLAGNIIIYGNRIWPNAIQNTLDLMQVPGQTLRYTHGDNLEAVQAESASRAYRAVAIFALDDLPFSFIQVDLKACVRCVVWRVAPENFAERSAIINQFIENFGTVEYFAPPWEAAIYIIGLGYLSKKQRRTIAAREYHIVRNTVLDSQAAPTIELALQMLAAIHIDA